MTNKVHSIENARENFDLLLADVEQKGPQIIEVGKKRFEISYIGVSDTQRVKDLLAKGGPLTAEDD